MKKEITTVTEIKNQIGKFIGNKENLNSLLTTTFKGLTQQLAEQAMLEGMIRGFDIRDFMEKNVYAIPFKQGYSLVTSIEYARKIGMRSGVVGKSAPEYTFRGETDICKSCSITIKRMIGEHIGEYTATVFFSEYNTGYQQWEKKPLTMIAKVAEMHALRMACPEELSQAYSEDEMGQKDFIEVTPESQIISDELRTSIAEANSYQKITDIYNANEGLGKELTALLTARKQELTIIKNNLKKENDNSPSGTEE
jgi:hypothetical protein